MSTILGMEKSSKKLFTITITTSISKYVFSSSCEKRTILNFHPFIFPNKRELTWIELDRVVNFNEMKTWHPPLRRFTVKRGGGGRGGERG